MVSELLLYRGKAYHLLENRALAREWLERAKEFSEEHGTNQISFQAEAALEVLRAPESESDDIPVQAEPAALEELADVRDGLNLLRQELAPMGQ
jgi:hypothetical protein